MLSLLSLLVLVFLLLFLFVMLDNILGSRDRGEQSLVSVLRELSLEEETSECRL